ncbi:MAG: hypothetical protein RSG92_15295 [Pseudomonas sp.]
MLSLYAWCAKWGVPPEAARELAEHFARPSQGTGAEAQAEDRIVLAAQECGGILFRNNKGALPDKRGRFVRFGLCNETPARGKALRSADEVGILPIVVTPAHVGTTIGQFLSIEAKRPGWRYAGDEHERGQMAWAKLVERYGGRAFFATGRDDVLAQLTDKSVP